MVSPKFLEFQAELEDTVRKLKEYGFEFPILKQLIIRYGAVKAAKILLDDEQFQQEGFLRLKKQDLLEYSVEQIVLNHEQSGLFSAFDIEIAKKRLGVL